MMNKAINVVIAGLGGQGVLKASDILADAVFRAGYDVKKAEVHGMSQRGGSVNSDVRFGRQVLSPMIPDGEVDYLLVLAGDQVETNRHRLREGGLLIEPSRIPKDAVTNPKTLNTVFLGILSQYLDLDESIWMEALLGNLPEKIHEVNRKAFDLGRAL
jgi:indolepyruvate ferredoxin oxidoreductase, beta subunit